MEIAGIPTVEMLYSDQTGYFKNVALTNGCPNIRCVAVPRIGHADEAVPQFIDKVIKALTDPLTAKEKEVGLYSPPAPPRVIFEGTLFEAQDYLQQTTLIENCRQCPIAKYTDGLPVIIPTEEAVAAMLTGTSHKPTETVGQAWASPAMQWGDTKIPETPAGAAISYAQKYTATVEKVAITAVMAGCKPQYMPVAMAIATSGGGSTNCPGTSSMATTLYFVSGPIAKEIGMNSGQNSMDVGNPANMTLGRVGALMTVNFGGCITGAVRSDEGNMVHSTMFAEDLDGLPMGWVGFNQESTHYDVATKTNVNYTAKDSVVGKGFAWGFASGFYSFPGYYRSLNQGQMGLARWLGVEGTPGYYNWMEVIMPIVQRAMPSPSGQFFIMHMNLAEILRLHGFKTKTEVYQWMCDTYYITVHDYWNSGLYDFMTNGGLAIEQTSGKSYIDLLKTDPNYKLHLCTASPMSNCIVVADSFADEHWYWGIFAGRPSAYAIDPWK
jgi:hypothetical protein